MLGGVVLTSIATIALFTAPACSIPTGPKPPRPQPDYKPASNLSKLAKLMPTSALPAPTGELKYVLLGVGTQNYTCTSGNDAAAPGTTGASAQLYDIGSALNNDPMAKWKIPSISPLALSLSTSPQVLDWSLETQGYNHLVGHHFFWAAPVFALDQLAKTGYPVAQVGKVNDTAAPASACPGLTGEGAVRWLFLKDTKGLSVGGVDTVYRVETAGGAAPATCKGMKPSFEVKYATQYWVYGPKK